MSTDPSIPRVEYFRLPAAGVALPTLRLPPHECSYFAERQAVSRVVPPGLVDSARYQHLMDRNFRRSGDVFYRPECDGCAACVAIRVPVAEFRPSRAQRRTWKKCADLRVSIEPPACDAQRYAVYSAYQAAIHADRMAMTYEEFERFFGQSPIDTLEFTYWAGPRLIGAGLVDVTPRCLSSVYFYYDPVEARRSPGIFSSLCEIEECRHRGLPYWYSGYWVRGCAKMEYKTVFRPYELLGSDGEWRPPG